MKKRLGKKESVFKQGRKKHKSGPILDGSAHDMDYMDTKEAVNEGRQSNETKNLNLDVEVIVED
ncbi:hypothetical protein Tco_0563046, partial [Tanacetum coccineum]